MNRFKIIRTSTIPMSLNILLKGQLKFLNNYYEIIGVSSSGNDLNEVKIREGIGIYEVNMKRGISPFKDIVSLFRLYFIFRREKPMLVHSITPKAGLLSMIAAKMANVPLRIHTFTGLIFPSKSGILQKILIFMDKLLCFSATHIYPEGIGVKNDLVAFHITKKPLKIIGNGNINGIDLNYFSREVILSEDTFNLRKVLGVEDNDFVFIFVGRLVRDKGINELINAFCDLRADAIKLILVGPLELDIDPLETETIREIERNRKIIAVGFQKDVRPYFAVSNCLVFPSYREGFPNVVMQAGAMDLPSIVSNINGCNEIIIEGRNGIIIPPKDVNALKVAMLTIMNNSEFHDKLQRNARKLIQDRYDQQFVWSSLLHEYHTLIEQTA